MLEELFISTSVSFLGHARRYANSVSKGVILSVNNSVNTNNGMLLVLENIFFTFNFAVKQLFCSV